MVIDNCQRSTKVANIKVEENKKWVIFLNPTKDTYLVTKHDGCIVKNMVACDWVVSKKECGDIFIELKGKDINHATVQILASADYWMTNKLTHGALAGIIVGTEYPRINTQIQRAMAVFAKKYRGLLYIHSHNVQCDFDSIIKC